MSELRDRIERVYRAHPDGERARPNRRGAHWRTGTHWFARRVHRNPRTIQRWLTGEHPPDPLALDMLDALEREAGIDGGAGDGSKSDDGRTNGASRGSTKS